MSAKTGKNIETTQEGLTLMVEGATILGEAVSKTLGYGGENAVLETEYGEPKVTKDGVTVAKHIELPQDTPEDKIRNIGATLIKVAANKTNELAGDGTTTSTVLAVETFKELTKQVASGRKPMALKSGVDKAVKAITSELRNLSVPCTDNTSISNVGTISANSDKVIGGIIADAMDAVGAEGVITVEEGSTFEDSLKVVEGMQFDRGYLSPYFVTNQKNMSAELENPYILLFDKKITTIREVVPLEAVAKSQRPLVIIAEDIEGEALATLVVNSMRGMLKVCAVKAPGFGDRRKAMMEDIAILTSATFFSEELGNDLSKAEVEQLGS